MGSVLLIENKYGLSKSFFRISWYLRIHRKLSTILKQAKKGMKLSFLICQSIYILKVYAIHWENKLRKNTQVLKKTLSDKIDVTKNALFFLSRAPTHNSFTLIRNSYTSWSTWFISLKMYLEFFIFDSVSFLLNFIFLFNKKHRLFNFKTP